MLEVDQPLAPDYAFGWLYQFDIYGIFGTLASGLDYLQILKSDVYKAKCSLFDPFLLFC